MSAYDARLRAALRLQHRPPSAPQISIATPETWMDDALCAQVDMDLFFPEKGGSTKAAKKICGACPVTATCLAYALEHNERFGIWGQLSERERRRLGKGVA